MSPSRRTPQPRSFASVYLNNPTAMSTTEDTNPTLQLDSTAPDGSKNATNITLTTEEMLRAKIKTLESQLQACQEEVAHLNKIVDAGAAFYEDMCKVHEENR